MRLRKPVLILLFFTVLAPIVLYTDRLGNFSNSYLKTEFIDDVSTLKLEGNNKINALRQEILNDLKEPAGIIRLAEERDLNHSNSVEDAEETGLLDEEKNVGKPGERVLSTTTHGEVEMGGENLIKQVTEVIGDHILKEGVNSERENGHTKMEMERQNFNRDNEKNKVSQQKSETTTMKQDVTSQKEFPNFTSKGSPREPVKAASKVQTANPIVADAQVRHLRDQLIRAKVYLSLGLTRNNPHFIKDLRARIREVQRALGEATKDSELPRGTHDKLKALEQTLAKGKEIQDDCSNVVKKLRAMLHSSEEQLRVHKKQTLFLTQLAAKTIPKGLHCLPLRLGTEYYLLNSTQQQFPNQEKLEDPKLYHYALFSDNILAAAVVVNSTVLNAKEPEKHVFHIVSDRLNYAAMRMWFLANSPGKATIEVRNVEEFTWLNSSYSPVLKQLGSQSMIDYYFRTHRASSDSNLKYRNPKYLNILNHLRFYLPEIFPKLHKVLFLDDDIVVQKDLTGIWMLNLKGKVNGAVETCGENFHRFDRYLNFSNPLISKKFDPRACGWAYGMNIFDLEEWKKKHITQIYHSWQKLNRDRQLWKLGTLPPGLITFWNQTYPLDRSWHVLGLGYNPNVSQKEIEHASVIHYNGNMKPWLEIGIPKYRNYWAKYVDYDQMYLRECNINP